MELKKIMKRGMHAVADLILPRICIVCGDRLLLGERHICLHCLADMPLTRFWDMKHNPMADRFNAAIQTALVEDSVSGHDGQTCRHERYAYAAALFFFSDDAPYRNILYSLKYKGRIDIGRHFGRILGTRLASSDAFRDVDCVIPVPLHWLRLRRRGYNQAEVIAREVASALGARLDCKILKRHRRTRTQTALDVKSKSRNVAGAFSICGKHASKPATSPTHVLLIDDVFTTGSTLMACFTALRSVFPPSVRISVATLGFVGGA